MRHFFALLSFALMSSSLAQLPDYIPSDGLVAWYSMNGDTEDAFGDFDGVPSGLESSIDRFGNSGSCFHFSGGNSHVDLGVDGALVPATALTYAVWMKPSWDASYSQNTIVGRNTNGSSDYGVNWGIYGLPNNRILRFGIGDAQDNGVVDDMDVPYSIEEDSWVHYAVAYDAIASSVKFFIDGQEVAEEMTAVQQINDNGQTTFIGKYRQSGGGCTCQWFTGALDDLGIWNRALASEELWAIYQNSRPVMGCTDVVACNYVEEANVEDGSCEYGACHCLEGTIWSGDLGGCVVANPSDTDFDGCVGMIDLLDLLSVFGTCNEAPWSCGEQLEYHGYDYETVQIGDQCWFAENARFLPEVSPAAQGSEVDGLPHAYVYGYDGSVVSEAVQSAGYANGALYNFDAVVSWEICPAGWYVPGDEDWMILESFMGMDENELEWFYPEQGFERGADEEIGFKLKSVEWDGGNSTGFSALSNGWRWTGVFAYPEYTNFWTSTQISPEVSWARILREGESGIARQPYYPHFGKSVRCVQESE